MGSGGTGEVWQEEGEVMTRKQRVESMLQAIVTGIGNEVWTSDTDAMVRQAERLVDAVDRREKAKELEAKELEAKELEAKLIEQARGRREQEKKEALIKERNERCCKAEIRVAAAQDKLAKFCKGGNLTINGVKKVDSMCDDIIDLKDKLASERKVVEALVKKGKA